jgi:ABC-2 type transport system ATP-binding protein
MNGNDNKNIKKEIDYLLDLVKLEKWRKTKIKNYSKGMMQRLGLAQAIINNPELIFLDEPTDGVDPIGRKEIRDLLIELKQKGKTIFLNSHLLTEVELFTDRVAIMNKGVLLKEGTVKELTEKKEEYQIQLDSKFTDSDITLMNGFSIFNIRGNAFDVKVENPIELNRLIDKLRENRKVIKSIILQKETLEEMFIHLIEEAEGKKK